MRAKDIKPGLKTGRITVIKKVPKPKSLKSNGTYWLYRCDCGTEKIAHATTIWRSLMSCGCIGKEKRHKTKSTKHYRRLYHVWHAMKKRCYRKEDHHYKTYGALGIKVCKRWHKFANFYNDMIDSYKPGLSIERIDIDNDYKPSNCTWIPLVDQAKNRRSSLEYRERTGYNWKYAKRSWRCYTLSAVHSYGNAHKKPTPKTFKTPHLGVFSLCG